MRSLVFLLALAGPAFPSPAFSLRYDQTQTGDLNIHLDLKNVQVLAVLDDTAFGSIQYDDYSYEDMTLKPPAVGAVGSWNGSESGAGSDEDGAGAGGVNGTAAAPLAPPAPTASLQGGKRPSRRCGAGFYRDGYGKCRRIKRPTQTKLQSLAKSAQSKGSPRPGEVVVVSDSRPLTVVSKDELNQKSPFYPGLRVTPPAEFEGPPAVGEAPSAALLQALAASKVDALERLPEEEEKPRPPATPTTTAAAGTPSSAASTSSTPAASPSTPLPGPFSTPRPAATAKPPPKARITPNQKNPSVQLFPKPPKAAPVPATIPKAPNDSTPVEKSPLAGRRNP